MGLVQKIFYYHMPSAWMFLLAAIVCGIASVRFLATGDPRHDRTALAAAELMVALRPARRSSPARCGRGGPGARSGLGRADDVEPGELDDRVGLSDSAPVRRAGSEKLAAALALFGMANVPFIYISVNYWRTIHPPTTVVPTLPLSMGLPLWFCVVAFVLLFVLLLKLRVRLEEQQARARRALSLTGRAIADDDAETLVCRGLAVGHAGVWRLPPAGAAQPAASSRTSSCRSISCRRRNSCRRRRCWSAPTSFVLAVLFLYVLSVARRLTSVQQEIDAARIGDQAQGERRLMPTAAHFLYIPGVLLLGIVIGWILGSRAAADAYAAQLRKQDSEREARRSGLLSARPRSVARATSGSPAATIFACAAATS